MSYILRILCIAAVFSASCELPEAETEQEKNKDVARQFFKKVWQEHNTSFVNEATTEDFDRAGHIAFADTTYARFPDFFVEVVDMIAEEDKVAAFWKAKGTSAQELSKGKEVTFPGMTLLRFEDGKIAEGQGYYNQLSIMEQLGFTLQPPSAEPSEKEEEDEDEEEEDDED